MRGKINYTISRKLYTAKDIKSEDFSTWGYPVEAEFATNKQHVCVKNGWKFAGFRNGVSNYKKVTIIA